MKYLSLFFVFLGCLVVKGQQTDSITNAKFINSFHLQADEFIGVDEFDNIYYLTDNTFYKKKGEEIISYTNTQLGKITSVDIKNPLKIILYYSDFNTIILLDNKLNELSNRIDFNKTLFSKNISLTEGSSNNNLWIYSLDDNTLQIYNYKTEKIRFTSQPLVFGKTGFKAKKLVGSYKNCWLIGESSILQFNEYGTFLNELEISDATDIELAKEHLIYLKNNGLYIYSDKKTKPIVLEKEISIESFYVNKNEIYIFDGTTVFVFSFTEN